MLAVQAGHRLAGVAKRGTASAERHRGVIGLHLLEQLRCAIELCALLIGLGWKEFKADRRHRAVSRKGGWKAIGAQCISLCRDEAIYMWSSPRRVALIGCLSIKIGRA